MKKLLFTAFGLCLLAACSQDEVMEVNRNGDEITFDVVTNAATRATDVYCNNNMPTEFHVSAISDKKSYIEDDTYTSTDGGETWTNTIGTRYWPETATDFYAHVNGGESYEWSVSDEGKATAQFLNFTVNDEVANQVDLLYAVKTNETKETAPVELNFRHALSQIVFQAKNTSKALYVEIYGIKVANVGKTNTFTFPDESTVGNFVDHTGAGGSITGVQGTWADWDDLDDNKEQTTDYAVSFSKVEVPGDSEIKNLTNTNETDRKYGNVMLLLPQSTTAWDPETSPDPDPNSESDPDSSSKPDDQKGSFFRVNCLIYNVNDTEAGFQEATDVCLWGTKNDQGVVTGPKELAIPVGFNWEQGKKYVYTLVFGHGNGGYNPDPDPDDPEPEPVLVPITFDVTVDDFVEVKPDTEIESGIPGADAGE